MHDEVSETENLRKNLSVERMIVEGCDILLDVNQVFVRQGELRAKSFHFTTYIQIRKQKRKKHTSFIYVSKIIYQLYIQNMCVSIKITMQYQNVLEFLQIRMVFYAISSILL